MGLDQLWSAQVPKARVHVFHLAVILDARLLVPDGGSNKNYSRVKRKVREILEVCASPEVPHQSQLWCARQHMNYAMAVREWVAAWRPKCINGPGLLIRDGSETTSDSDSSSSSHWASKGTYRDHSRQYVRDHTPKLEVETCYRMPWSELRFSVLSTLGTRFSADLTELIFQHLICAEGVRLPWKWDDNTCAYSSGDDSNGGSPDEEGSESSDDELAGDEESEGDET